MEVISVVGIIVIVCQMVVMALIMSRLNKPIAASLFSWLGIFFASIAIAIAFSGVSIVLATPLMSGAMMNIYLFMHFYLEISK